MARKGAKWFRTRSQHRVLSCSYAITSQVLCVIAWHRSLSVHRLLCLTAILEVRRAQSCLEMTRLAGLVRNCLSAGALLSHWTKRSLKACLQPKYLERKFIAAWSHLAMCLSPLSNLYSMKRLQINRSIRRGMTCVFSTTCASLRCPLHINDIFSNHFGLNLMNGLSVRYLYGVY